MSDRLSHLVNYVATVEPEKRAPRGESLRFDRATRERLRRQHRGTCYYCKRYCGVSTGLRGTVDHLIPLSRGGPDAIENLVYSCKPCNQTKGNKTPTEYEEWLVWRDWWNGLYQRPLPDSD
jgi:5-methylcytosine-specific restriction endonuclease McrA